MTYDERDWGPQKLWDSDGLWGQAGGEGAGPQVSLAFRSTSDGLQLKKGLRFQDDFFLVEINALGSTSWQGSDHRSSLSTILL